MTYKDTLDYIYHKLPMFSRMGSVAFKKDLTNIKLLCKYLQEPQKQFRSIHVGGTNGKGSTSHMLAAVLQTAGYKTGLYTSPHLYDFRERIKINGEMVNEDFVVDFVNKLKEQIEIIEPSFFEITVAMAFHYFAQQQVDVAIIEVGLGGRLDSTNIIDPELSVITNIGWDHMNMLGNTLPAIAGEKAGIIKSKRPVIIGESHPETIPVFMNKASAENTPIFFAEEMFTISNHYLGLHHIRAVYTNKKTGSLMDVILDMPGFYQLKNIRTVLATLSILQTTGFNLSINDIHQGLQHTKQLTGLMGRWEVLQHDPLVVLEVAHNYDGIVQVLDHLKNINFRRLHIIMGIVKDKEPERILALLPPEAQYYFTKAMIPRALAADILQKEAARFKLTGRIYENVNMAIQEALQNADKQDLILICGSIFLIAEVNRNLFKTSIPSNVQEHT